MYQHLTVTLFKITLPGTAQEITAHRVRVAALWLRIPKTQPYSECFASFYLVMLMKALLEFR